MHDHNNNGDESHKGMMWMMLLCCLIPVVILFGGARFFTSVGYGWIGIVLIGGFAVFHVRHMFGSHKNHISDSTRNGSEKDVDHVKADEDKPNHKSCCH
jgi:hypothetical protein